jgi:hypothetical protein
VTGYVTTEFKYVKYVKYVDTHQSGLPFNRHQHFSRGKSDWRLRERTAETSGHRNSEIQTMQETIRSIRGCQQIFIEWTDGGL